MREVVLYRRGIQGTARTGSSLKLSVEKELQKSFWGFQLESKPQNANPERRNRNPKPQAVYGSPKKRLWSRKKRRLGPSNRKPLQSTAKPETRHKPTLTPEEPGSARAPGNKGHATAQERPARRPGLGV